MTFMPPGEFHTQLNSTRMRETQVAAFREILENGLLSRMRFLVYQEIHEAYLVGGTLTSGEIDRILSGKLATWTRAASPRLNELVRIGVIKELGKRVCSETKMTVLHYTVVEGALPKAEEEADKPPRATPQEVKTFLEILIRIESCFSRADMDAMEPVLAELFARVPKKEAAERVPGGA